MPLALSIPDMGTKFLGFSWPGCEGREIAKKTCFSGCILLGCDFKIIQNSLKSSVLRNNNFRVHVISTLWKVSLLIPFRVGEASSQNTCSFKSSLVIWWHSCLAIVSQDLS